MRFEDYHRTVIGYHGTKLSTALDIVNRRRGFERSMNDDDWLGHGIYFWEYAPHQAKWWAERRKKSQGWTEPVAIVASMIRLGFCFDLLDPQNVARLQTIYGNFVTASEASGRQLPKNYNSRKFLDCAVFQFAYAMIEKNDPNRQVDTSRAVYVPTGDEQRVWPRSWIAQGAHIQLCVRNPNCILGTWLHYPTQLETTDDKT